MIVRLYGFNVRNRPAAIALAAVALSLGAVLLAFGIVLLLGTGMGLMFSAINVLFRDLTRIVQTLTQMIPFSVPMMYPYTMVAERFQDYDLIRHLYLFNPLTEAVLLIQRAFWITTISDEDVANVNREAGATVFVDGIGANFPAHLWTRGFACLAFGVVFLLIAQWVFRRLEDRIPERL